MRRRIVGAVATASLWVGPLVMAGRDPAAAAEVAALVAPPAGSVPSLGGDVPVVGDWDGNGTTTIGIRRQGMFHLRNSNTSGVADVATGFGDPGDVALAGDWDGNGTTTVGIWRAGRFYLRNSNADGDADLVVDYGAPDDVPLVGDWDGNGTTTVGVWRSGTFHLRNENTSGVADVALGYGDPGDVPLVGDWDGNATTTVGVQRANSFLLRNENTTGAAQVGATYGDPGDVPLAGDWDGNGSDTLGLRRGNVFYLRNSNTSGVADQAASYGDPTTVPAQPAPGPAVPALTVDVVAAGLTNPWDLAFTPDGTMLVTERPGRLSARLADGTFRALSADLSDLLVSGETGLMGIEVDPGFATNRRFYTCQGRIGPSVQVVAWTVDAAYTSAVRVADPLVGGLPSSGGRHGGCRPRIGPDGALWIGTGDAVVGTNPQDVTSLGGKVLRVDPSTGQGLPGNPFFAGGGDPRVYSYGHRNVQGLALRPGTAEVWAVEQGTDRDDEINLLEAGGNYGYDPVPGYNEAVPMTNASGVPARWSSGFPTLALSGGAFLAGPRWGAWNGALVAGALKNERLWVYLLQGDSVIDVQTPAELAGVYGRLRTPRLGPDGNLYVTTDNGGTDAILRVTPRR